MPEYRYTFQIALFNTLTNAVIFQHIISNEKLNDGPNIIFKRTIPNADYFRSSSYVLYVTDMTYYKYDDQPLLELTLDVSSSILKENNFNSPLFKIIKMSFKTDHTTVNERKRRIEMPIPPVQEIAIYFDFVRMNKNLMT